ncbi:hypothetical protein A3K63_04810 [Candidatus Micrarchaeota archaeon RBG_16_49_10]|nr:MAG: hypothetical protein A3K63_04810 [Candidatus Micrarchaeota archaeon RBG_16_49_10]
MRSYDNGEILYDSYVLGKTRNGRHYRLGHLNPGGIFLVPSLEQLEPYFEAAETTRSSIQHICVPCVVGEKRERATYRARVLIPPALTEQNSLFLTGLLIPNVSIAYAIEGEGSRPAGYILKSPYLGSQYLYTPKNRLLEDLPVDARHQAIIVEVFRDEKRRPRVVVLEKRNSHESPTLFFQNEEALEAITELSHRMWWNQKDVK